MGRARRRNDAWFFSLVMTAFFSAEPLFRRAKAVEFTMSKNSYAQLDSYAVTARQKKRTMVNFHRLV